jgi:hypothetical protein
MYEIVQSGAEWIVRHRGEELARYAAQADALQAVAERMRLEAAPEAPARFAMRFQGRS